MAWYTALIDPNNPLVVDVDAGGSLDPAGGGLTYLWTASYIDSGVPAIADPTAAATTFDFTGYDAAIPRSVVLCLTVTDVNGNVSVCQTVLAAPQGQRVTLRIVRLTAAVAYRSLHKAFPTPSPPPRPVGSLPYVHDPRAEHVRPQPDSQPRVGGGGHEARSPAAAHRSAVLTVT